jgi:hypothetical protein
MFDIIQRKIPENNVFGRNITKSGKLQQAYLMGELHSFRIKATIIFIFNNLKVKLELHFYLYIT